MNETIILQRSIGDRANRAELRRRTILNVSRQLFIDNGFHGTGVAQIAEASGIKVGQIYRDFACKEDIIAAIVARDLGYFLDEDGLERAIAAGDIPALRRWIDTFVAYAEDLDGYRLMPEIIAESSRNERIAKVQGQISDRVRWALLRALEACAPGEARRTARCELADFITILGSGMCQWMVMERPRGRDARPLCAKLSVLVDREIEALVARA